MESEDELLIEEMPRHLFLRARRRALGFTQAEVAQRIGTTQSVISAVEGGRRSLSPTMDHKLAEALKANPADLLDKQRQQVRDAACAFGFDSIRVFGSVASGMAGVDSDVDFFVGFPAEAPHDAFAVLELRRRLENILSVPVDLISVPKNPDDYGGIYLNRDKAIAI